VKTEKSELKNVEWWLLLAVLGIILVVIFAVTNAGPVPFQFFLWQYEISLALLIFLSVAVGIIIAVSLGLVKQYKSRKTFKDLYKEIDALKLEKEAYAKELEAIKENEKTVPEEDPPKDKLENTAKDSTINDFPALPPEE